MISVVCVYNNHEILDSCLLKTLKTQTYPYELILLDNQKGAYASAAIALNKGAVDAIGDILMFCHQDMRLESSDTLSLISKYFERLGENIVIGTAGKSQIIPDKTFSNMRHGIEKESRAGALAVEDFVDVDTLDECLFAISRNLYKKMQFDEKTCFGWHLYAVDYCLSVHTAFASRIFVVDLPVFHYSDAGSMNSFYFSILKRVCRKHRKQYKLICTTMGSFKTKSSFWFCTDRLVKAKLKKIILRITGHTLEAHIH